MNSRKEHQTKGSALPVDYLKMVSEVFSSNFDTGLKAIKKLKPKSQAGFKAYGMIYPSEIVLAISLFTGDQLGATTAYASSDYDPKASSPTAEDLLGASVDAIGSVFSYLFETKHPKRLEQVLAESLSALEDIPFKWTEMEVGRFKIHLLVDKSNPDLDLMADDWLSKNDPGLKELEKQNQEEAEKLFVTGKPKKH